MGLRFRRRIRLLPGIAVNLSKTGASLSVGGRGGTVNFGPRGTRTTLSIPGTGISYSTLHSSGSSRRRSTEAGARAQFTQTRQEFERAAAGFPAMKKKGEELIALAGPERGARLQHILDEMTDVIDETGGDLDSVLGLPRLISEQAVTLGTRCQTDIDRLQRLSAMAMKEARRLAELLEPGCTAGVHVEGGTASAEEVDGAVERPERNTTAIVLLVVLLALGALGAWQALRHHRQTSVAPTVQPAPAPAGPARVIVPDPTALWADMYTDQAMAKVKLVPIGRKP
jgi:hypothetical protein